MTKRMNKFKYIPVLLTYFLIVSIYAASAEYIFWNTDAYVTGTKISSKEVKKQANEYAKSEVRNYVNSCLANYPIYKKAKESTITSDGFVNASVDIRDKSTNMTLISAQNVNFQLGQGVLPDKVEELLLGAKSNATRSFAYKAEDCMEKYGAKSVQIDITVHEVIEPQYVTYDDITDAYAKKLNFNNSSELINTLQYEASKNLMQYKKEAVYSAVSSHYKAEFPDFLVRQEANEEKELIIKHDFNGNRSKFKNFISNAYETEDDFNKELQDKFIKTIEQELILTQVGKDIGVQVTGERYDQDMQLLAESYGYDTKEELFDAFTTSYESGKDYIDRQYLINSAIATLCDYEIEHVEEPKSGTVLEVRGDQNGLIYTVPNTRGFKSYMDYKKITSKTSNQYRLQQYAQTTYNGLRTVNGRYCIALGTYFDAQIGQFCDLILENGTKIECILGDIKADVDTEDNNIVGKINNCCSEFIIDDRALPTNVLLGGNISKLYEGWDAPVKEITIYNKKVVF